MSDKIFSVPEAIKMNYNPIEFEHELLSYPSQREYNEIEKIKKTRSEIRGLKNGYTRLNSSLWVAEFMDIPSELIKSIEFVSEYKLAITFYESEEFCVEKFFNTNFDLIDGKKITIKYLNKEGLAIRTDTYTVNKLCSIDKKSLTNEIEDIIVKITLECKNHVISTCKE